LLKEHSPQKETLLSEIYISVDIETSGPIPSLYSMLSVGAAVVGNTRQNFYRELKPTSYLFIPEALNVSGFDLKTLEKTGTDPKIAMQDFETWIKQVSNGKKPVFTAFNATFDWSFVNYYFHENLKRNPFGISGLDIKAYYMGKFNTSWGETSKRRLDKQFLSKKPHTHNALDDAIEQAEIFEKMLVK